jgi:hypothetical protein
MCFSFDLSFRQGRHQPALIIKNNYFFLEQTRSHSLMEISDFWGFNPTEY